MSGGTPTPPAPRPVVLLVDDEPHVLSSLRRMLRAGPYEVVTAEGGAQALHLLRDVDPAVVLSDMRMPNMNGVELLAHVRQARPRAVRMILSAHADLESLIGAINEGAVHRFLSKPWRDADLRAALDEAVAQHALAAENERLRELTARQNAELQDQNRALEARVAERTTEIAALAKELAQSFLAAARLLARPVEARTRLVGGHSTRVATLAVAVAERLGVSAGERFSVEVAATLHDVGKLSLPVAVLEARELLARWSGRPPFWES